MKRIFTLFILISSFHSFTLQAQSSSGWKTATSIISNSSWGDVGWSNPLFASLNDGSRTSSTALIIGDDTEYLQVTGFNINIPAGMVIKGIEVEIIKNGSNGISYNVTDNEVRIIKGGVVTGNNLAASGKWPSSDQTFTYGSASETWGTTWTLADVNSSNFGIAISAHLGGVLLPTARINSVSINVSYGIDPLPVAMISFSGKVSHGKVDLSWATATEVNNHGFIVQRSVDAVNWENIGEVLSHFRNSETVNHYTYTDFTSLAGNNYYRLLQRDNDNSTTYTNVIVVNASASDELSLYPNPANDLIHVSYAGTEKMHTITLSELTGNVLQHYNSAEQQQELIISTADLSPGEYLISMSSEKGVIHKMIMVGH